MASHSDNLIESVRKLEPQASGPSSLEPRDIAKAFGWNPAEVREREIRLEGTKLDVGRSYYGVQPAALFATPTLRNGADPLEGAALYGYHAAVRWGLLVDEKGLTPFNSHWVYQDRFFTLPPIHWDRLDENKRTLEAFRPDNLAAGDPDRLALERYPNPTLLQPVDDELVDRLDSWRDEALKASKSSSGVDEQLQVLFAKLFVLRTIEDRGLAPDVPPLSAVISGPDAIDHGAIIATFERAKQYIGSELFDTVDLGIIPEFVVSGIISDLYTPRRLPGRLSRYNFSWIDSDVLGMAYEKYLSTILHPSPAADQSDLFRDAYRGVSRVSVRKAGGVYYTPEYLTKSLARSTLESFYEKASWDQIPRIIDFACGSGSFLVASLDALLQRLKQHDANTNWGRKIIEGGYLCGVDVDEKAVTVARLNVWNRLTEEPDPLPLPNLSRVVVQGDGLNEDSWGELPRHYDIALGNPPFLTTSMVTDREILASRFETAKGRFDYSYLFVEQALRVTEPSGTLGMVVPNRLFINPNGSAIRSALTSRANIKTLIDFGSNEVFQGTSAYIGCVVAEHQKLGEPASDHVRVIEVKSLPEQFVSAHLLDAELGRSPDDRCIRTFLAQHPRGPGPWILLSLSEKQSQIRLSELSTPLSSVAGIFQGIRTGANDVFILNKLYEDEGYGAQVTNGLGDSAVLERDLLQPVVFGPEVRKFEQTDYSKYIIYPYIGGIAISEAELQVKYPQTFRYLSSYRDILGSRTSLIDSGLRWYELVRRRDEDWLRRPKLLIRDLAPEISFAVDPVGELFIVGGTAVIPENEEKLFTLLGYLNSKPINSLVRRTTPRFRGGFQKFEPQHLQRIPILHCFLEDTEVADRLGEMARTAALAKTEIVRLHASQEIDRLVLESLADAGVVIDD